MISTNVTSSFIRTTARFDDLLCNNISNELQDTTRDLEVRKNDEETKHDNNISVGIYRYKFTNELTNDLFKFSKFHQ